MKKSHTILKMYIRLKTENRVQYKKWLIEYTDMNLIECRIENQANIMKIV